MIYLTLTLHGKLLKWWQIHAHYHVPRVTARRNYRDGSLINLRTDACHSITRDAVEIEITLNLETHVRKIVHQRLVRNATNQKFIFQRHTVYSFLKTNSYRFIIENVKINLNIWKFFFYSEQDICLLPALLGECHNYTQRWYFDSYEQRCRQFYYGSCGGNENNFVNEDDCMNRCESSSATPPPHPREFSPGIFEGNKPFHVAHFQLF